MQPVTLIAPSRASAPDLSHYLGPVLNGGLGSTAVRTTTLDDLAGELAVTDSRLAGCAPLPALVRDGAVAAVLADASGLFADVADQPATAHTIAATSAALDAASNRYFALPRCVAADPVCHRSGLGPDGSDPMAD